MSSTPDVDPFRSAFDEEEPCGFYGVQLLRVGSPVSKIVSIKGRIHRCGLYTAMYSVCVMLDDARGPRWKECPYNPSTRKRREG